MSEAVSASPEVDAPLRSVRPAVSFAAPGVLLAAGLLITFTATLHQQIAFDRWVVVATLAALAAAHALEALRLFPSDPAPRAGSWSSAALSALAAVVAALSTGPAPLAIVIAAWAVLSGIATSWSTRGRAGASDRTLRLLLWGGLAAAVLACRHDPVAVIGLFGAYAVLAGVFLSISALDGGPSVHARTPAPRG